MQRRSFLKQGGLALFGIGAGGIPKFVQAAVNAHKNNPLYSKRKVLVCIFQRGAMDGLMAVSPFNDPHLQAARPNIFMPAGHGKSLIDLDGTFGLHPGFSPFADLFKTKQLAIVHGMGSPNPTRSHFDAQDYMESGTPFRKGTDSGWLNRALSLAKSNPTPFQAVSITSSMPRSLYGEHPALAINNIQDFNFKKYNKSGASAPKSFEDLYDQTSNDLLKETGKDSFEAIKILQETDTKNYQPANGSKYPQGNLGNSLKQIAQLIKMDVGLEIAFAESGGWDTHFNQGTENGIFARNAKDFSESINALWTDLGQLQDEVTIMTMTEFGRTVKQNGTNGTDHGRASCSFILGNDIQGGKVYNNMKSLDKENLEDDRDLPVSTDFRTVFNEVATKHLKLKTNNGIFPDWEGKALGILKS